MIGLIILTLALLGVLAGSRLFRLQLSQVLLGIVMATSLSLMLGSIEAQFFGTFTALGPLDLSWIVQFPYSSFIRERIIVYSMLFITNTVLGVSVASRLLDLDYVRLLTLEFGFAAALAGQIVLLNSLSEAL